MPLGNLRPLQTVSLPLGPSLLDPPSSFPTYQRVLTTGTSVAQTAPRRLRSRSGYPYSRTPKRTVVTHGPPGPRIPNSYGSSVGLGRYEIDRQIRERRSQRNITPLLLPLKKYPNNSFIFLHPLHESYIDTFITTECTTDNLISSPKVRSTTRKTAETKIF